jgi:hypothetical protein
MSIRPPLDGFRKLPGRAHALLNLNTESYWGTFPKHEKQQVPRLA